MDYVNPKQLVSEMVEVAGKKAALPIRDLLLRGFLAGGLLSYATSLVFMVLAQGLAPIVGAVLFPVGFVILVLLGLELATGNFALLPAGLMSGDVKLSGLVRNWTFVYLGNFLGSIFYAGLFYLAITNFGTSDGGYVAELLRQAAQKKTLAYASLGASGWFTALVKGILCNWMVTLGVVMALVSRSTIGKIIAMWLPITTFFAHGYEHSIVNMFVIPAGMMFHAPVSTGKWLLWNQLPVTIGNIISGALLTGMALYLTYRTPAGADKKPIMMERQAPLSVAEEVGAASI